MLIWPLTASVNRFSIHLLGVRFTAIANLMHNQKVLKSVTISIYLVVGSSILT